MTIIITDPHVIAMLERIAAQQGVSPREMVEILVRVRACDTSTIETRKQGRA